LRCKTVCKNLLRTCYSRVVFFFFFYMKIFIFIMILKTEIVKCPNAHLKMFSKIIIGYHHRWVSGPCNAGKDPIYFSSTLSRGYYDWNENITCLLLRYLIIFLLWLSSIFWNDFIYFYCSSFTIYSATKDWKWRLIVLYNDIR